MSLPTIPGITAADMLDANAVIRGALGGAIEYAPTTYGRVIRVRRTDKKQLDNIHEAWGSVSAVAESWSPRHDTAWIKLKTSAQVAADEAAGEFDWQCNRWPPVAVTPPTYEVSYESPMLAAEAIHKYGKKRNKHSGIKLVVMQTVGNLAPTGCASITDVVAAVVKQTPKGTVARGTDRRAEYASNAITKLTQEGYLHVQGENQEFISLHRVIEVDE